MASVPRRPVLVVDLGAQYAQLIARRIRECHVYSEIVAHDLPASELAARRPAGIVLSGGPASVYEAGAPALDPGVFELGVPVLGICYGHQLMAQTLGGEVAATGQREYGRTRLHVTEPGVLLEDLAADEQVWMSHGDAVDAGPRGVPRDLPDRRDPDRVDGGPRAVPVRGAVPPRGRAHAQGDGRDEAVPLRRVRPPAGLDTGERDRARGRRDPRAGRAGRGALRALRRRRLGRGGAPRPQGGRRAADVRVRRHRAAARGRARAGRGDVRPALPGAARAREGGGSVPRPARGRDRPRGQAAPDRRGVHPRLRGGRARAPRAPGSSSRGRCTPT